MKFNDVKKFLAVTSLIATSLSLGCSSDSAYSEQVCLQEEKPNEQCECQNSKWVCNEDPKQCPEACPNDCRETCDDDNNCTMTCETSPIIECEDDETCTPECPNDCTSGCDENGVCNEDPKQCPEACPNDCRETAGR